MTTSSPHRDGAECPMARDGVVYSQMPPFQPDNSVVAPTVLQGHRAASGQPIQHGYNRARLWDKDKRFGATFCATATGALRQWATMKANINDNVLYSYGPI